MPHGMPVAQEGMISPMHGYQVGGSGAMSGSYSYSSSQSFSGNHGGNSYSSANANAFSGNRGTMQWVTE